MIECGVVIDKNGGLIHTHQPPGRTAGNIPDTRSLWDVFWEHRENILGFAHSHPGSGVPGPSHTDVTTFAAIEAALGKRIYWWITSSDAFIRLEWVGPEKLDYKVIPQQWDRQPWWAHYLREISRG